VFRWSTSIVALLLWQAPEPRAVDPLAFLAPTVRFGPADLDRLDHGTAIVRVLPGEPGEIAIVAAVAVTADRARFTSWIRHIAALKKSDYVSEIARFSDPPALADLSGLTLDDDDLEAIRQCRADHCDLNLGREEVDALQRTIASAGREWRAALQPAFRQLMLARVQAYRTGGQRALPVYVDDPHGSLQPAFDTIVAHSPFLAARMPPLTAYLQQFPQTPLPPQVESFLYWSKEHLGGEPTTSVTHVAIYQSDSADLPEVIVAGKQIFATHYTMASLNITALARGRSSSGHYLVYFNRSRVGVLDRWFGGLARLLIERRVKGEAADVLQGLRSRIDSGDPPDTASFNDAARVRARTPAPR